MVVVSEESAARGTSSQLPESMVRRCRGTVRGRAGGGGEGDAANLTVRRFGADMTVFAHEIEI